MVYNNSFSITIQQTFICPQYVATLFSFNLINLLFSLFFYVFSTERKTLSLSLIKRRNGATSDRVDASALRS